jgi:glycosyltransferase involved in cell wall biosynthesis
MKLSDIYVAPSRSEGFGLPLVEAALCEKPVITADMTATREKVADGETGFIVKSVAGKADLGDLASHLEKLLADAPLRDEFGRKGRERALEFYRPEVVGKMFLELIS